jgi:Fe-S-cluster-containing dehydrogenase component
MVIDLHRCTGCGACAIGCKKENNTPDGIFWAHFIHQTVGVFPNVKNNYLPTLCNHCENAPCVEACPVNPKAMYKGEQGLTLHDLEKCIGCRACENSCPYGVISFNAAEPHAFWRENTGLIEGGTSSPREVAQKVGGNIPPYYNPDRDTTYAGIRPVGKVEKCTLCDHRIAKGLNTYCNTVCPSKARFFGDLDQPDSEVAKLLQQYESYRLKEEEGTEPRVYYIRTYNPA